MFSYVLNERNWCEGLDTVRDCRVCAVEFISGGIFMRWNLLEELSGGTELRLWLVCWWSRILCGGGGRYS